MPSENPKFWNHVYDEIFDCLDLDRPKSFFLLAGAGSGKTRALVEVLKRFGDEKIRRLRLSGQKVAIITYTNGARDEIRSRLGLNEAFSVCTIHSFSWNLIKPYTKDIRDFLKQQLPLRMNELEDKQQRARSSTSQAYRDREKQIEVMRRRLEGLDSVQAFEYDPLGENSGVASLQHAEVIDIASSFLSGKPAMKRILTQKYPILLIDECQDTQKKLVEVLLDVRNQNVDRFCLGLFGDMMQRIYPDGKHDLLDSIDETWVKPKLDINYRSPMRILTLINKIRTKTDGLEQKPHPDSQIEGTVRLFIAEASSKTDRAATEREVCEVMASATRDPAWRERQRSVKVLALEHHMVAQRAGFARFWESLNQAPKLKAGLPEGKLEGIPFFRDQVVPLISARRSNDGLTVARMVREHSLLLDYESLKSMSNPSLAIQQAKAAVECVFNLWQVWDDPPLSLVLERVHESGLFPIPDVFAPFVGRSGELYGDQDHQEHDSGSVLDAWREALDVPFSEVEKYVEYITDRSAYGTHQGVKGLEFPRVMVIADDGEAKGTVFSYEKVFGAKELSARDFENQAEGKETSLDRTMRLLYVTCSRAQKSLALVVYTANPHKVQGTALSNGWFSEDEIVMM